MSSKTIKLILTEAPTIYFVDLLVVQWKENLAFRVHSSVPWHFEKMFTATLLALGTRLVKFHFSSLVKISVFASFALKIEQLSIKWAQGCLKLKIWVLIRLKHAWKPKLEVWNFTSLVPRARSVAVNIFSKCHGKDEWTLDKVIFFFDRIMY